MAFIYKKKLKSGYVWMLDYTHNGKRYRKSTGTSNKKEAERILDKIKGDLAMDKFGLPNKKSNNIKLKDFIEKYLEYSEKNKSSNTFQIDKNSLKNFYNFIGDKVISDISGIDIENYKINRIESVSKVTVNIELKNLKAAFERAVQWNILPSNVFKRVQSFKV